MKSIRHLLAAFAAAPCLAQSADPPTRLDPIVVTPTRSAQQANRLPAALVVITRADIEASGAAHLADVLRARAGVEVIDTFGDGSRILVGLRGFGENAHANTLVLVDGRRLNNADIGAPDLNSVALADVERIEIVAGSLGALYGDQAVGGVIHIITRGPEADAVRLGARGGSYNRRDIDASAVARTDRAFLRFSGTGRYSDNYRDHNALDYENFAARGDFEYGSGALFGELQAADERLETPGALLKPEMDDDRRQAFGDFAGDFASTETTAARIGWRQRLGSRWQLETDLAQRRTDGAFRLSFRGAPASSDTTQRREVHSLSPRLTGSFPLAGDTLVVTAGGDGHRSDYALASIFGEQSNEQTQLDGYLQVVTPLPGRMELTLAGRASRVENELRDGFTFPAGAELADSADAVSAGLAWRVQPALRTFVRVDQNYRFPKVDEYFGAGGAAPATALKTQTGVSSEIGAQWQQRSLRASLVVYRLDIDDELAFDPALNFGFGANTNLPRTRRDGQLLELGYQAFGNLSVALSYAHVQADLRGGSVAGNAVPLSAEHVGRLLLDWSPAAGWSQFVEIQANSERHFSGDYDNSLRPLPGYGVVNAGTRFVRSRFSADLRVNNLLDKEYSEFGAETFTGAESYFPSPEVHGWLGVGLEF